MLKQHSAMKPCSECFPGASGSLAITMPSGSITAANSSVAKVLEKHQKQAETKSYVVNTEYVYWTKDRIEIRRKENGSIWYQFNHFLSSVFDLKTNIRKSYVLKRKLYQEENL